jgi:hypothetical protein
MLQTPKLNNGKQKKSSFYEGKSLLGLTPGLCSTQVMLAVKWKFWKKKQERENVFFSRRKKNSILKKRNTSSSTVCPLDFDEKELFKKCLEDWLGTASTNILRGNNKKMAICSRHFFGGNIVVGNALQLAVLILEGSIGQGKC